MAINSLAEKNSFCYNYVVWSKNPLQRQLIFKHYNMSDEEIIEINPDELDENELFLDDDLDMEEELDENEDLGINFGLDE